ncbi:hypothetical protein K458DRAFT_143423 [Lentithecium fluviatile CBS 122367]|uniref:Uncharacterized protein n=1 Tax=Lentithecium fluviatile CBS 122367 TaxID=1168545 RepID=A0A6G1III7_9PLEO|nr:hypothetical protein K458DRAFT_143423 [Lentithecium fluviatile CBS 122367]
MSIESFLIYQLFTGALNESSSYHYEAQEGSATLMAIWNTGSGNGTLEDMRGIFSNIEEAITTHLRIAGPHVYGEPVKGLVWYDTTCMRIRWGWVAYSTTIVGLTFIFFVGMILQATIEQNRLRKEWTHGNTAPPNYDFKSSALTLLYHGLDQQSVAILGNVGSSNRETELDQHARDVHVRLVATEQGWKLPTVGADLR